MPLLPKSGVTAIAAVEAYDPLAVLPGVAVRYAGDAFRKLACSFCSLYFSRQMLQSSAMATP